MSDHGARLRDHTDAELLAVAEDLLERSEQFDAATRSLVNDELRRRRLPTLDMLHPVRPGAHRHQYPPPT